MSTKPSVAKFAEDLADINRGEAGGVGDVSLAQREFDSIALGLVQPFQPVQMSTIRRATRSEALRRPRSTIN